MTRKDYELIARTIKDSLAPNRQPIDMALDRFFAGRIALELKRDNANFNREKFLRACGVSDV